MAVFYPFVWLVNVISNAMLTVFDIDPGKRGEDPLDREELRTVVKEAGAMIPTKHKQMLTGILDLEKATVEDIMVPRSENCRNRPRRRLDRIAHATTSVPAYTSPLLS